MTEDPRPGWYPDPAGTELFRWWDGSEWAEATSERPGAAPAVLREEVGGPARRRSPFRAAVALVIGIALFVSAAAGFGLVLWRDPSDATAPERDGAAGPIGELDESTGIATIGPLSMVMPDDPYVVHTRAGRVPGVFDVVFTAEAVVHARYDGMHSWSSTVLVGQLASGMPGNLEAAGTAVIHAISERAYGGKTTKVGELSAGDHSIGGEAGEVLTAKISYEVAGLPSTFDRVVVVVVGLDDGTVVAAASVVPDDAAPELSRLAQQSLDSLGVR